MTNAGALLGTPAFMPPELALGQQCDHRADLYSLGVVLYLLGSGNLPFQSDSAHELIAMHGTEIAPAMTEVPAALGHVIDRLLAKDPNDRYQSAAETREALEAALEQQRYNTPVGTPLAAADQSFGFNTPLPSTASMPGEPQRPKRSATEISRLVGANTVAVADATKLRQKPHLAPIFLGGFGAIAVGAIVFLATRSGPHSEPTAPTHIESPAAPSQAPPDKPAPSTPEVAKPAPPDPEPVIDARPDAGAAATVAVPSKPGVKPHPTKPHPHNTKPPIKQPLVRLPAELPAQGSGSGSGSGKKPHLPF